MDDTPPDAAKDSALHEYVDAEVAVDALETPGQEKALYAALQRLPGVQNVSIAGGKVAVRYEPVRITKERLIDVIQGAGFRIAEIESGPASPLTDAFASKGERPADRETSPAKQKTTS